MSNSMQINIGVSGLNSAVNRMGKLLADGKQFQGVMSNLPVPVRNGGGGGSGGGSVSSGPMQRAIQAQMRLHDALLNGSKAQVFDAQAAHQKAQAALVKAQTAIAGPDPDKTQKLSAALASKDLLDKTVKMAIPKLPKAPKPGPDFMSRLGSFISSSRIGMGGGGLQFMPLVGRLLSLFGASGPIGIAVTAGAAAISAFVMAVHHAAEALNELRNAALVSGGSNGDLSALTAMGFSPGQAAQAAAQFSSTSASSGFAAYLRSQAGVGQNVGGPMGELNQAAPLAGVLKYIASLSDAEDRRRKAMEGELTAYMPLIEAMHRHKDAMEADAAASTAINSQSASESASDLMFELGRLGSAFQELLTAALQPMFGPLSQIVGDFADFVRDLAVGVNVLGQLYSASFGKWITSVFAQMREFDGAMRFGFADLFMNVYKMLSSFVNGLIDHLPDPLKAAMGDFKMPGWDDIVDPLGELAAALNKNTAATDANTGVFKPGTYGGGQAVRGAVPSKWTKFDAQSQIAIWNAQRLGAFAMG